MDQSVEVIFHGLNGNPTAQSESGVGFDYHLIFPAICEKSNDPTP